MLTCPNSLLFRVRTSLRHPHPLFSSLSDLSLHLSVLVSSASHLPCSMTSHILITVLLSQSTDSFPCLSYLCLLPSPPRNQTKKNLPAHEGGQRFMWSVWFLCCELHVSSCERALPEDGASCTETVSSHNFSKDLLSQPEKKGKKKGSAPVKGSFRFLRPPSPHSFPFENILFH